MAFLIAAGVAGVAGLAGNLMQGDAQSSALDNAARVQEQNAREAQVAGEFNAQRQQLIAGKKIGSAEAAFGASGVSSNSGSVLDVIRESHANAELDRLNILHGADIRGINYQNQASMDRIGAKSALTGSYFGALSSVAGSGMQVWGYGHGATAGYQAPPDTSITTDAG